MYVSFLLICVSNLVSLVSLFDSKILKLMPRSLDRLLNGISSNVKYGHLVNLTALILAIVCLVSYRLHLC